MWDQLTAAFALLLIAEGLLPFIAPDRYKKLLSAIMLVPSYQLRITGLCTMLIGLLALYLLR